MSKGGSWFAAEAARNIEDVEDERGGLDEFRNGGVGHYHVDDAFRDTLSLLVSMAVPDWMRYAPGDEENHAEIIEWLTHNWHCCEIAWSTYTGMVEAAELVVQRAIENANLFDQKERESDG